MHVTQTSSLKPLQTEAEGFMIVDLKSTNSISVQHKPEVLKGD